MSSNLDPVFEGFGEGNTQVNLLSYMKKVNDLYFSI